MVWGLELGDPLVGLAHGCDSGKGRLRRRQDTFLLALSVWLGPRCGSVSFCSVGGQWGPLVIGSSGAAWAFRIHTRVLHPK